MKSTYRLSTALCALTLCIEPSWAQRRGEAIISTPPGTVVRWHGAGTTRCGMKGRSWAALQGTCYYPVDLEQAAGTRISISRSGAGRTHLGHITVESIDYGTEEITLPDIPQANPSAADLRRDTRDRAKLGKIFTRRESVARFSLPLSPQQNLSRQQNHLASSVFSMASQPRSRILASTMQRRSGVLCLRSLTEPSCWRRICSLREMRCLSIMATVSSACTFI